jgi:hypothetical protein
MKARFPLIAALAVALVPMKASAQAWLSSPDFSEGTGIRAGNLELHPSFGAEAGYDSNFYRSSKDEGVIDVFKFRFTPSITIGTLDAKRLGGAQPSVIFSAGAHVSYFEVVPVDSANSLVSKRRNAAAGADALVDVFPQRKVGFDIGAGYIRAIDTEGNINDLAGEGFNRDTVRGGAGITWRPGGGLFSWRGGYAATYNFFENSQFSQLNNLHHEVSTRGRWRFLPRSALLFDTRYTFVRYANNTVQTDGDAVNTRIGFHGLVTYHLSLLGMVGWAASFYQGHAGSITPRQYDSVVANAEARWFLQARPDLEAAPSAASGLSSVALGYTRSFSNSYYGSFYQRDRGYLQFSMFILGAIASGLEFGVSSVHFPEAGPTQPAFSQVRLDGRLFGEYRFTDALAVNASVLYDQVNSDPVPTEDLSYTRWQAFIGARLFW